MKSREASRGVYRTIAQHSQFTTVRVMVEARREAMILSTTLCECPLL